MCATKSLKPMLAEAVCVQGPAVMQKLQLAQGIVGSHDMYATAVHISLYPDPASTSPEGVPIYPGPSMIMFLAHLACIPHTSPPAHHTFPNRQ